MKVSLNSFAKLNLSLKVFSLDKNNLHPISSIFKQINLYDTLEIQAIPSTTATLILSAEGFKIPLGSENILHKIFGSLSTSLKYSYKVHIKKNIPLGSGMGGASSNAATFLTFINQVEMYNWSLSELQAISHSFGSDIAFFFLGGTQDVSGFGNTLSKVSNPNSFPNYFTIIYPNILCSTKDVYAHFDYMKHTNASFLVNDKKVNNDLFPVVLDLFPEMKNIYKTLSTISKKPIQLSGSGSTFFVSHDNLSESEAYKTKILKEFPSFFVKAVSGALTE